MLEQAESKGLSLTDVVPVEAAKTFPVPVSCLGKPAAAFCAASVEKGNVDCLFDETFSTSETDSKSFRAVILKLEESKATVDALKIKVQTAIPQAADGLDAACTKNTDGVLTDFAQCAKYCATGEWVKAVCTRVGDKDFPGDPQTAGADCTAWSKCENINAESRPDSYNIPTLSTDDSTALQQACKKTTKGALVDFKACSEGCSPAFGCTESDTSCWPYAVCQGLQTAPTVQLNQDLDVCDVQNTAGCLSAATSTLATASANIERFKSRMDDIDTCYKRDGFSQFITSGCVTRADYTDFMKELARGKAAVSSIVADLSTIEATIPSETKSENTDTDSQSAFSELAKLKTDSQEAIVAASSAESTAASSAPPATAGATGLVAPTLAVFVASTLTLIATQL